MNIKRKTAFVVCPGRGTYNPGELGYLQKNHANKTDLLQEIDAYRNRHNQVGITELDQALKFDPKIHTRSDNASSLIYACAYADYLDIDQSEYEIIAVTGNSMGWYIALACANALTPGDALHLINSMGSLMQTQPGGQVLYPLLDDDWQALPDRIEMLESLKVDINNTQGCELFDSINLGGFVIFAGNNRALDKLMASLPKEQSFPMRLENHAAFHTPLMQEASQKALTTMNAGAYQAPNIPLIDGRGHIWTPYSSNPEALWNYTLGHQIISPYNFTQAIKVGMREFAPDCLIILGPGNTLGGATAQSLVKMNWQGLDSKHAFSERQVNKPLLFSMGLESQRRAVCD